MTEAVNLDGAIEKLHSLEEVISSAMMEHDSLEFLLKTEKKKQESYESQISAFQDEVKKLHEVISGYQRNQEDLCNVRDENISLKKEINSLLRKVDEIREEAESKVQAMQSQIDRSAKEHEIHVASSLAEVRFENDEKLQSLRDHLKDRESKIMELNTKLKLREEDNERQRNEYEEKIRKFMMQQRVKSTRKEKVQVFDNFAEGGELMKHSGEKRFHQHMISKSESAYGANYNSPASRRPAMVLNEPSRNSRDNQVQTWRSRLPYKGVSQQAYNFDKRSLNKNNVNMYYYGESEI